ncbi:tetratricopeptide repeat protein [Marinicella litoralis]|uniref:Sel1 repeat-containing protein n=1 Tax=Marinicella litoralis TaxID=644220 RepID=A0A4R6Y152_9GAMM|nr:tetratricopeptide repeat protein [Marinicella litoralis]TDR22678.1 Sel1 repeat-containing protein [Marinicella litoralis]
MDKIIVIIFLMFQFSALKAEETVIPPSLIEQVESGHAESAFFIATAFAEGTMGIEKNLVKAKEWFLKSAEMGYVHGMYEIGKLLYGEALYVEAKSWFEKASEQGHGEAFYRLSLYPIYSLGDDGFDCHKAYELLEQASSRDVKAAFNDYAWMLATLPDKSCRNGQKAWRIFSELQSLYGRMEPIPWAYLDTKAAVFAEIAEFNEAIEVQSWIVEDFCDLDLSANEKAFAESVDQFTQQFSEGGDELCYGAIRRLQSYVQREPWREQPQLNYE